MNRRLFLGAVAGLVAEKLILSEDECYEPVPQKKLVLDYLSKDPALYRTIISTNELKPSHCIYEDGLTDGNVVLLCAKRAWILTDGRLEVEHYSMIDNKKMVEDGKKIIECHRRLDGEPATYTIFLKNWIVRHLSKMGEVVGEEHS